MQLPTRKAHKRTCSTNTTCYSDL